MGEIRIEPERLGDVPGDGLFIPPVARGDRRADVAGGVVGLAPEVVVERLGRLAGPLGGEQGLGQAESGGVERVVAA